MRTRERRRGRPRNLRDGHSPLRWFRYELQIRRGDADAPLLEEGLQDAVNLQLSRSGRDISFDAEPGLVHLVDGGESDGARFRDERLRVECTVHVADSRKLLGERRVDPFPLGFETNQTLRVLRDDTQDGGVAKPRGIKAESVDLPRFW